MNDQGMGRGAKIVSGTVRDSLHMVDVIFGLDGGELPEIVVSDTGSYSDLVFGLLELLGISYRPALPRVAIVRDHATRTWPVTAAVVHPGIGRSAGRTGVGSGPS